MMQRAYETIESKRRPERPPCARRVASIKETGEELPLEYWERFEAAVGIVKGRSQQAAAELRDAGKSR